MTNKYQCNSRLLVNQRCTLASSRCRKKLGPPAQKVRSGLDIPVACGSSPHGRSGEEKTALGRVCVADVLGGGLVVRRVVGPVLPFSLHRTIHKVSSRLYCQALQPLAFCAVAPRVSSFRCGLRVLVQANAIASD